MSVSPGVIAGVITMLGFGLSNGIIQPYLEKRGFVEGTFWLGVIITVVVALTIPFFWESTHFNFLTMLYAFGLGCFGYIPMACFYKGVEISKLGVVAPIANSSALVTSAMGILLLNEEVTLQKALAIITILSGIVLMSTNFADWRGSAIWRWSSGVPYAIVSFFSWGVMFYFLRFTASELGPALNAMLVEVGVTLCAYIHLLVTRTRFTPPQGRLLALVSIAALTGGVGAVAVNWGIVVSDLSIVTPIVAVNPLISLIYAWRVHHERLSPMQVLAALVIVVGVILIAL